jgi:ABC-2 type transport system permease protein
MLTRTGNVIVKDLIQFRRDWVLVLFILLAPALQLILMARTVGQGISEQPVVVLDQDHSRASRQLIVNLDNTGELEVQYFAQDTAEMRHLLDGGKARLALVIPTGFARSLYGSQSPEPVQIIADTSNTVVGSTSLSAATGAVEHLASSIAVSSGAVTRPLIDLRTDVRFNPELDFRIYSIPAMVGFITYQVTLAVAAQGLARERELGTLEQLMVTPLRRLDLTSGKGVPALAVGIVTFAATWGLSVSLFHVPMRGSLPLLIALTLLFIIAVVSWGLVISAISHTQQQAILFVFILAMTEFAFSGFLVPVKNMPAALQAVSRLAPLQHYLVIIRGIMLKSASLSTLWPQALALAIISLLSGLVALLVVARRLD